MYLASFFHLETCYLSILLLLLYPILVTLWFIISACSIFVLLFINDTGTREVSERWGILGKCVSQPSWGFWWKRTPKRLAGLPRSWPLNRFELLAVGVLFLGVQGLRVLQEVLVSFVLRLDLRADGGGALALKASGQSCRRRNEKMGGVKWCKQVNAYEPGTQVYSWQNK